MNAPRQHPAAEKDPLTYTATIEAMHCLALALACDGEERRDHLEEAAKKLGRARRRHLYQPSTDADYYARQLERLSFRLSSPTRPGHVDYISKQKAAEWLEAVAWELRLVGALARSADGSP